MQKWLQRSRGAIGMAVIWAVAWGIAGMLPRWVFGFNADAPLPLVFGVLGFFAGLIFSAILVLTERRRTFDQMSTTRFATWGAVGGLVLAAIFTRMASLSGADALIIAPTFSIVCAACATGSLALARRADRRELSAAGGDIAAQLTTQEKRKLL